MHQSARLFLLGQLCLFVCLSLCVLLIPHFLFESNEGGVSNYGTFAKTVVPYTLGFGLCGILTIKGAWSLPAATDLRKRLRSALVILGVLYLLVLFSTYPYKVNHLFDDTHELMGGLLVMYSVIIGAWLVMKVRRPVTTLLFIAQLVGFGLATATYIGTMHTLFIAELLENTAFGALLAYSVRILTDT